MAESNEKNWQSDAAGAEDVMADSATPPEQVGGDVTRLLLAWSHGDQAAFEAMVPLLYAELRHIAHRQLRGERPGHTLQTGDLVNEAFLRLVDSSRIQWQNRAHFLAVAAQAMRRILVDAARARHSLKRGGDYVRIALDERLEVADVPSVDLVALDEALTSLASADARRARVVELRFFGGLGVEETAEALGISADTVMRDWKVAKAWLFQQLRPRDPNAGAV